MPVNLDQVLDHAQADGALDGPVLRRVAPRWRAPVAILVLFALSGIYAFLIYAPCDDTYIYLVYAKNFLNGHGLTFNGMKVQGFTSPLWMGLIVALGALRVPLPVAANLLSVLSGLFGLAAAYALGRSLRLSPWMALVPPLLLATTWDFVFYMGDGLESVFFMAMVMVSLRYAVMEDPQAVLRSLRLPAALSLTILARPEGVMVAAVILVWFAVRLRNRRAFAGITRCAGWMAVMLLPVYAATRIYYGDWLPNTYYAKAGAGLANFTRGLRYFLNYVHAGSVLIFFFLWVVVFRLRRFGTAGYLVLSVIVIWAARIVMQGGDNMVGFRALLPITPLIYVTIVCGLAPLPRRAWVFGLAFVGITQVALYSLGSVYGSSWNVPVYRQAREWRRIYPKRIEIGQYFKDNLPPNSLVALNAAGIIPYYSEQPTIDMLGLNNYHIAHDGHRDRSLPYGHQAGDGKYVLDQKPAVIMFGGLGAERGDFYLSDREIYESPDFVRYYNARQLPNGGRAYFRVQAYPKRRRR